MRTRTIYNAMQNAEREMKYLLSRYRAGPYKPTAIETRKGRQFVIFERELLRRMDERDALVAREHAPPDIRITAINGLRQNTSMPVRISFKGANE